MAGIYTFIIYRVAAAHKAGRFLNFLKSKYHTKNGKNSIHPGRGDGEAQT